MLQLAFLSVLFLQMYSYYLRERIVALAGTHAIKSVLEILKEEGHKVSRTGVYYVIKKYKKDGILHDYPRSGRPRSIDETMHDHI